MARTTIDGLKVREPKADNRPAKTVRKVSPAIDMMRPAKGASSSEQRRQMLNSIDTIRQKNAAASSFLDPVETFDFDAENISNHEDIESSDWSELLNDAVANHKETVPRNDFLNKWDDEVEKDLLEASLKDEPDEPEVPNRRKDKSHPHKKHHFGRVIAVSIICLLVIAGGAFYKWGDELISRLTGGNSGLFDAIHSMISDEVPFLADTKGRTNVLVFGTEGYSMSGETAFGAHDGAQLTDSIMVVSFDQNTKDVALMSLPRDLKVSRACSAGKINEVFWCHNQSGDNEDAGAKALMEQVGDVLGLDFQYYAHVNWASLIDIIDTLGGITVTLDENIADYGWTNAVAQAGVPMEINGEQALGLARARHGTTGGDFTRGNTQQKIVEGIVAKLMQSSIGMSEAFNLVNILGDNLRTNFSTDNIKAGVRMLNGFDIANIRQIPLIDYTNNIYYVKTATINDISYVVPSAGERDYTQLREYIAEALSNNPADREHAKIAIYNASVQFGVAGAERDKLTNEGYEIIGVGDAELGDCVSEYCVYVSSQEFPATQAALGARYGVEVKGFEELPSDIVPGEANFIIVIGLNGSEV